MLALGVATAAAITQTFEYTGGEQTFAVSSGVHNLRVRLAGGSGGEGGGLGGRGAEVSGNLEVTPGQTLYVEVGGNGESSVEGSAGGFNGGSLGGIGAGGGGGASDIRLSPRSEGLAVDTRLIVAAGGGGGGGEGETAGGAGGDAESSGETSAGVNEGGGPGTASTGGSGGLGCSEPGAAGELGAGGGGIGGSVNSGGGGGGGLYGGGGGGGGCSDGGGGGGGGSSLVHGLGLITTSAGEPKVEISYTPAPSISLVAPVDGGTYTLGQAVTASYSCTAYEIASITRCEGSVSNGSPLDTSTPGPHAFLVNAEDNTGGTASKLVAYTVAAPSPPTPSSGSSGSSGSPSPPGFSKSPPDTVLGSHPPKKVKTRKRKTKVKFTFFSPAPGATFECKLDRKAYAPCVSPKAYKLKPGKHQFSVEAVSSGLTDPTPASFGFKIVRTP
jgi:Glycine rich protein